MMESTRSHSHARTAGRRALTDGQRHSLLQGSLGIYLILSVSVRCRTRFGTLSGRSLAPRTRVGLQRNASQMDIQCTAGFEIVGLAALGAAASEFISWLLIYRKQEYQRLSASIEKAVCRHTRVL